MDREYGDVFVDWIIEDLSRRALHDGCDRGVRGSVDLDPGGEIRRDGVGAKETKKVGQRIHMIFSGLSGKVLYILSKLHLDRQAAVRGVNSLDRSAVHANGAFGDRET